MSAITEDPGPCVETTGPRDRDGYGRGQVPVGPGSAYYGVYAHRLAFEQAWGTIPDGMVVRHTCDNPPCVNPLHLQVGTNADNSRDRDVRGRNANAKKSHCPQGHPYDEKNTYYRTPQGWRQCRKCPTLQAQDRRVAA